MSVIGIDIDTKRVTLAVRLYENSFARRPEGMWSIVTVEVNKQKVVDGPALRQILSRMKELGAPGCAIETPYLGKNVKSYGVLMMVFGQVVLCAYESGLEWEGIGASTWQSKILGQRGQGRMRRKELKAQSILVAKHSEKAPVSSDHEADAVCLSAYATKMVRFR